MSVLDTLITIFLLASAMTGYRRGIFREILVTSLWVPTLFAIGFIIVHSISADGVNSANLNLLFSLGGLYLLAVITVWGIDAAFIQPHFKGSLQSASRLFYKATGLILALLRAWLILVVGIALYSAYVNEPDEDIATHGLYMPYLAPDASRLRNWLEEEGYINHEQVIYTDEVYTYQSEVDDAKQSLKNSFTQKWLGHDNEE